MDTVLRLPLTASATGTHNPTIEVSQSGYVRFSTRP